MDAIRALLALFQDAVDDVESLKDYFYRSNKTLIEYRLKYEHEYQPGKKIADEIDRLFEISSAKDRNSKIPDVYSVNVTEKIKIGDVCEIALFEKDEQNSVIFSLKENVPKSPCFDPRIAKQKFYHLQKYEFILIESILSHIVVSFENFLSNVVRVLIRENPPRYFEDRKVLLSEVFSDRFDEVIAEQIDLEVTKMMYDSLSTLKNISDKESISIDNYKNLGEAFKEIYYRRNAYVHTKGRVNKDYFGKVNKKLQGKIKIGDSFVSDEVYLRNAIVILGEMIFAVTFELLKKYKAKNKAIWSLGNYYFEKLKEGEYKLSKFAYGILSQYSVLPFAERLMFKLNYINAAKQLGEKNLVEHELKSLDVSATETKFKIAKACLSEKFDEVFEMLKEIYPNYFDALAIKEWPIFIDFRKTHFYDDFQAMHSNDFQKQQIEEINDSIDDLVNAE